MEAERPQVCTLNASQVPGDAATEATIQLATRQEQQDCLLLGFRSIVHGAGYSTWYTSP